MKIAVLFPGSRGGWTSSLLRPVVIAPGLSAGAYVYLDYAFDLAQAGFVVFLPDIKGDCLHLLGLELLGDPLISIDLPEFRAKLEALRMDLAAYQGVNDIDLTEVARLYKAVHDGDIQDQDICDIFRNDLFAYRSYSLDVVVNSIFEVNEDQNSPLFGAIDTDRIGLEGHSLGCDEIVDAIVQKDGETKFWWSKNIKVAVLKAAQTCLHGIQNFQAVTTPVFFMTGEYDNATYVVEPNWLHFNNIGGVAGYMTLYDAGHMVFVDAPIGFLGEKLIPFLGDFRNIDLKSYQRNRATISDLSVLIYNAFLKESPEATKAITQGTVNFYGEYVTKNM